MKPPKRCRDCYGYFEQTDVRRVLCDGCRKWNRRQVVNRAMQSWWARQPEGRRRALYEKQYFWQKRRELRRRQSA